MSAGTAPALVPLAELPGINALARGLAEGDPAVRAFLPDAPDLATVRSRARALGEGAAVVAGQQAGLFTGPLLTLLKALATRQLAAESGTRALFWCASEDHDLVEVTRLAVPLRDGGLKDMGPDPALLAGNRRPVGDLAIDADLTGYLEAVAAEDGSAPDAELLARLRAFHEGRTFFQAFAAMLPYLLNDPEQRVVDAAERAAKPRLVPLAVKLVRERATVRELLRGREERLAAAGHALQVTGDPQALPLFARVGEERLLLREESGRFTLKGAAEERGYTEAEVVRCFESGEWLPSFSALTRPLATSTLFPVAATVLGPAEVAYWAQMYPLFAWAGIAPPVITLRPMAALLDPGARRLLESTGIPLAEVLRGREELLARHGRERGAAALARLEAIGQDAAAALAALAPQIAEIDPNLGKPLETTRQNVSFALGKLKERVTAAAGRADDAWAKKIARLTGALLPGGTLAERALTPVPTLLRFGRDGLLAALERDLRWDRPGLTVIEP